ncbi:hypothetical protein HK104_009920 [Borealophlyctis nickersoniae]|nr:hypothetical protein HK104_009920 [Borealophlyctis nickersoniae]
MDHRAKAEADLMSRTNHPILRNVGGKISPEMSAAKVLWLRNHHPAAWSAATHLLELPDFLTFKATGSITRSLCSLACKWTYVIDRGGWSEDFWKQVGLEEVVKDEFAKFGGVDRVWRAGESVANGLTKEAAAQMGIPEAAGAAVGGPVIDAYAGALSTIGTRVNGGSEGSSLESRMALICGTSTCHIAMSPQAEPVEGIWGPYRDVLLPSHSCLEGGQSATGSLLDHILATHPHTPTAHHAASLASTSIYAYLNSQALLLAQSENLAFPSLLTQNVHVLPDFHGNRSPLADPRVRGIKTGLGLDKGLKSLVVEYVATVVGICCGLRRVVESVEKGSVGSGSGGKVERLVLSGGLCKNELFVQCLADVVGVKVVVAEEGVDGVLLGSAMLGAAAAAGSEGRNEALRDKMVQMAPAGRVVEPCRTDSERAFYEKKYRVFLKMYEYEAQMREMME